MQNVVTIGPEFFAKEKNEYSNWKTALIREYLQNCIDAKGTKNITIEITDQGQLTQLTVTNDGEPMDLETIQNKLFALGESGKSFNDTIGGFGKAKVLLYFMHEQYIITTGKYHITGQGANYNITETQPIKGTKSQITIKNTNAEQLANALRRFCKLSQWNGNITLNLNGTTETLTAKHHKGKPRRDLEFGKIYTNRSHENLLIVRINGLCMFTRTCNYKHTVVVELTGSSADRLTSNRDSLLNTYSYQLDEFILALSIDRKTALKQQTTEIQHWDGQRIRIYNKTTEQNQTETKPTNTYQTTISAKINNPTIIPLNYQKTQQAEYNFTIKNTTGMKIPEYYQPNKFSDYATGLINRWIWALTGCYKALKIEGSFGIGFLFDEDIEAAYEQNDYPIYYINPVSIIEQTKTNSRSFKRNWQLTNRYRFISVALHEIVHHLGYKWHDEDYAAVLTDKTAIVMSQLKNFGPIPS